METTNNYQGIALVDTPYLDVKAYADRTGDTADNVRRMAERGLLPTVRFPSADGSTPKKIQINMISLAVSALELHKQNPFTPTRIERGSCCA